MRRVRTGSVLMEATIAITLVAMALAGVSQLLLLAGNQQRIVEARRLAHREVGNVMERVMALPETAFTEAVKTIEISTETGASLPAANLAIDVGQGEAGMSPIHVQIRWRQINGTEERVDLTAWKPAESRP